ncbi:phage tail sheath family protein [Shewanella surugensis]|uniref:Phage tail sheath subtilisin-like domain-containing protein n=1 Tax=Shewanella surugensis TaxID=212020 RepID=A0ABT0L7S8_9GAMM|nr:phage tail sheath C-terminal domain-containing protein [Shewanella surugensis]MCL1123749.1 phage tail sheath subtilisin-like domain-containing protein [Shewanella surugensis]
MGVMKTPGVYIVEKNAFPNSVVEVATAVPAFIGYTERADNGGKSLSGKPWRITSMAEFRMYYGEAPKSSFAIAEKAADALEEAAFTLDDKAYLVSQSGTNYSLYNSMLLFFQNGGGPCYIVSVGHYGDDIEADKLRSGITPLLKEQEPTMVVIPEVVQLAEDDCISVQQAALSHCGGVMKNRVAILDVYNGFKDRQSPDGDCIDSFRSKLGINYLDYSAAYYPWLNTTIVQDNDLSFENLDDMKMLSDLLTQEVANQFKDLEGLSEDDLATPANKLRAAKKTQMEAEISSLSTVDGLSEKKLLHKTLTTMSPVYSQILLEIKNTLNLLPPAAAMAGIYTMVDNARGVWKAPANVSLNAVVSPAVNISHDEQEDLNVTTQGKSINAIRGFTGEGTLVWGARTLDGNSLDWRYISVRRTLIMLEESIRLAAKAYVFEPNTANTWVTINSMITNFLTGIWKRGGLAGASPEDAFNVSVGLGTTMTSEDILEGILRVSVLVAVTRPAEFIEITFQQQMQKS